ncbi:MAG: DHH family phosphoesterase [Lachnospiraceae bacterium]|nr:DHH family phosphoesterase [Lachnospiraceae bacterium]
MEKYLRIPFGLLLLLIVVNVCIYMVDKKAGLFLSVALVIYLLLALFVYYRVRPEMMTKLMTYSFSNGSIQNELIKKLAIPYALVNANGRVLWCNKAFYRAVKSDAQHMRKHIQNIFTDITLELFKMDPEDNGKRVVHIYQENKSYKVDIRKVSVNEFLGEDLAGDVSDDEVLYTIYFYDETALNKALEDKERIKLVAGQIYIDNYEEAMESTEEVRRALLVALIDRKITKYMQSANAIIKKLEKDKYIFVLQQQQLELLQESKFSLLEEVRSINIGNETPVTLSIAVGVDTEDDDYTVAYEYSHMAMDLALGRGGDQAVVKKGEKIIYYGGKTQSAEKNTRVKARVKAHALKELLANKDQVIIMGHKKPDIDCLGSAIGIYRLAIMMEKKAHIVINEITSSIRPAMNNFMGSSVYPDDMFYSSEQALGAVDANTVVIVVDVNRPSYTECEELLAHTKNIVVIDHHRQGNEIVEHAILSYIEPYASSACEMIAEILQYSMDKPKLRPAEADAMYAGMLVDTNNFVVKTGVRTFEAASFLRKCGADMIRVRKAYRVDMESYKYLSQGVGRAEIFMDCFAISDVPVEDGMDSPNVLAAKVANELLDVENVRASFVLTKIDNLVYISARSIDDVNVQVIMEQFGGGGHGTVAGAQIENATIEEAVLQLKDVLKKMWDEGDF